MALKLWHCKDSRSLRPLWALEEMGLEYDLNVLPFPPRFLQRAYLEINPLGTVPYFTDGPVQMTESSGICHYLADKYGPAQMKLSPDHPEYGEYLNWLYHSDATLTFPQTLFLRYSHLEKPENRQPKVAEDYRTWYLARLVRLGAHLKGREYLCADRFTIADIAITYALYLGKLLGIDGDYSPEIHAYMMRMIQRPAFITAQEKGTNSWTSPAKP